ncbi:MAG: hypothetical protein APF81_02590 [Desulfosporosinus sp. BRH_c37]|nr:MAG: hypothetical protein APF81_02590 [Desulfosporosinus sp. BRH_c37]
MKLSYVGKLTLIFGLTWGLVGLDRMMVGVAAQGFMPDLKLSFTQLGLIVSANGLGVALGAWIIGSLSEFYGRRLGAVWGNLAEHIFSGLTGLALTFGQMFGIRALLGVTFGSVYGPAYAAIAEEAPPEKRGFYIGIAQSFFPLIGMAIGPVAAGYVLASTGWRPLFFIIAIPGILLTLFLAKFMREPASTAENIRIRKSTGKKVLLHEGKEVHIWDVLKYRNVILMTLVAVSTMAYLYVLFTFVPSFLMKVHGFSPIKTGWTMGVGGLVVAVGEILAPIYSDRIGRKPMLLILFAIGFVGGILFANAPMGTNYALFVFYFALFNLGLSSFPLYLATIPTESVPFTLAATAVALPMGFGEVVGTTVFPAIGGRIADLYGLTQTLYLVIGACAVSFVFSLFIKETAPQVLAKRRGKTNIAA